MKYLILTFNSDMVGKKESQSLNCAGKIKFPFFIVCSKNGEFEDKGETGYNNVNIWRYY